MHEVLISYSTKDKTWADAACAVLEAHGIRCWIAPRDIVPGAEWAAAIIVGIDACKVMVLIFSASANESPDVRREVGRAISRGLPVVPCRIEDVRPVGAMEYALGNTHWLDVFTPPVERQMERLAESVQALLPRERGASSVRGRPPLNPDSSCRTTGLRESSIPLWNWRGKHGLVAAGFTLFLLVAVSLAVVFWPRKEASSTLDSQIVTPGTLPRPVERSGSNPTTVEPKPSVATTTPREDAASTPFDATDPFQPKSVWVRDNPRRILRVTERKGETFQATSESGAMIQVIKGTVKDGKVEWSSKETKSIKGDVRPVGPEWKHYGTITSDNLGDKIDIAWVNGDRKGRFTLRLQK